MNVAEIMEQRNAFSFEVFPPKTDVGMEKLCGEGGVLEKLYTLNPDYISCTYGAGGTNVGKNLEVLKKIKADGKCTPVTHFTCVANTKEGIKDQLQTYLDNGIDHMLALRGDTIPKSMTKADYAEYRFESALAEEDDFDMLVMGRTQGKGCYCYVNGVLKTLLDKYIGAYRYVVIDNEAGMEHIARGTLPHVDALLLVSDCSRRGVQAVARIAEMVRELDLKPGLMKLIINRAPGGVLSDGVREEIEAHHLELAGVLPQDDAVYEADCDGKPSSKIPDASPVKRALHGIMQDLSL